MKVPLLDLRLQYQSIQESIRSRIDEVLTSQQFILGPVVEQFEAAAAKKCGTQFAVGMSSGTDAQLAVLMALGIGRGHAVLTTPYTFFATAGCISRVGARPVFIDIEPESFNICPYALEKYLDAQTTRRETPNGMRYFTSSGEEIRVIVPVHLFGQCADMRRILAISERYGIPVHEDASQSMGSTYGQPSMPGNVSAPVACGSLGRSAWFSFFPSKNLGAFGDAGLTVTSDPELNAKLQSYRMHGSSKTYVHDYVGGNFRLDALQAAVLDAKLPMLDTWSERRRANAAYYRDQLRQLDLLERVQPPVEVWANQSSEFSEPNHFHHIYHQYVVRVSEKDRDRLRAHLTEKGIGCAVYYPIPLHLQKCFADLGYQPGDLPEAERAARESLALPIFPELTHEQLDYVIQTVGQFFRSV